MRGEHTIGNSGARLVDISHYERDDGRWSSFSVEALTGICLLRSGGFHREAEGRQEFIDATTGHFVRPGVEERFRHPGRLAYRYTLLVLTPEQYASQVEGAERAVGWALPISTTLDIRHRALLAACVRGDDPFTEHELLTALLEELPSRVDRPSASPCPQTSAAHRQLAAKAQEALAYDENLSIGMEQLAQLVGSSPHHLSRVFRQETGRTLTSYRTELRVRAVLEDFTANTSSLADLAAAHGFADHAHLTRTIRRYHGEVPSALRTALRHDPAD